MPMRRFLRPSIVSPTSDYLSFVADRRPLKKSERTSHTPVSLESTSGNENLLAASPVTGARVIQLISRRQFPAPVDFRTYTPHNYMCRLIASETHHVNSEGGPANLCASECHVDGSRLLRTYNTRIPFTCLICCGQIGLSVSPSTIGSTCNQMASIR
jgi:hypothetical protein